MSEMTKTTEMFSKDADPKKININMKDERIFDWLELMWTEGVAAMQLEVYLEGYKNGSIR